MTTLDRLKATMDRHGWTQHELADYLGVNRSALGNWLTGTREAPSHVVRILDVLSTIEVLDPSLHNIFKPVKKTKDYQVKVTK